MNPTQAELADSYWAAHDRAREGIKLRLSEMRAAGFRGFVDVGWFYPSTPVTLRRSGKDEGSSWLRVVLFPVEARDVPLPFGWSRFEVSDAERIRVVARGDASL